MFNKKDWWTNDDSKHVGTVYALEIGIDRYLVKHITYK